MVNDFDHCTARQMPQLGLTAVLQVYQPVNDITLHVHVHFASKNNIISVCNYST